MLRSYSKQYGRSHVVKPEERKGKAAVGKDLQKRKVGLSSSSKTELYNNDFLNMCLSDKTG